MKFFRTVVVIFLVLLQYTVLEAKKEKKVEEKQQEQVKIVQTTGMADIRQAGEAEAYDRARQDASRKAVEEAIGTFVDSQVMTENGTLIQDKLLEDQQVI